MTRKTLHGNDNTAHASIAPDSICNGEYEYDHDRLRSRKTLVHQRFTRRNSKFLHIDDLYRSDSTITKLFLKINDIAQNGTLNNIRQSSLPPEINKSTIMTRNKLTRRQVSMYDKPLKHPASPTSSDSCFQLRSRRHTSYTNHVVESPGDDDSNHSRPMRELRSTSKLLLTPVDTPEQKVWDSGRPKRQIKPKRLSIDETPAVHKNNLKADFKKNKSKVINNDKLKVTLPKVCSNDNDEVLVKNRRKYESELSKLNKEAENFLFPKTINESSFVNCMVHENDTHRKPISICNSKSHIDNDSSINKVSKSFKCAQEEESRDSSSSDTSFHRKKRRLTQAEAFILDNQQYYKFETPGSRLRYQGSYLPQLSVSLSSASTTSTTTTVSTAAPSPIPTKNNGDIVSKHIKTELPTKKVKKKYNLDRLQFSFEVVPNSEAWYETFQRQDTGQERYISCCTSFSEERQILLPYELGSIAPLNPRVCFHAYHEVRRSFLGESPSLRAANCGTPDSCSLDTTSKTDDASTGDDTQSSADFHLDLESPFNRRRQSRGRPRTPATSKTPRKSPRQHASTLAILSSIIQQRRRKPKKVLPIIEEEKESKPDFFEITNFLDAYCDDLDLVEVDPEAINCNVHCKPSAVDTLEDYWNEPMKPKLVSKLSPDRKTVRKKRTNRTGWPNKCKRPIFKKEGSHSSSSIISTDNNCSKNNDSDENKNSDTNKLNGNQPEKETQPREDIDGERVSDIRNCVNVDLVKWENAERLLQATLLTEFQPVVRVQKLANNIIERRNSIPVCSRPKRSMPAPPKSPRMLRRPRDKLIN